MSDRTTKNAITAKRKGSRKTSTIGDSTAKALEVFAIYKRILEGATRRDILNEYIEAGHTGYKIDKWYTQAKQWFKANLVEEIIELRSEYYTRYNDLYAQLYREGKYLECKAILDSLTKLQGVAEELPITLDTTVELRWGE
ncbi:MAG: hypothetical protein SNG04_04500 [Rikenellaceae bacterium]